MADDMQIQAVLSADASNMVSGFQQASAAAMNLQNKLSPMSKITTAAGAAFGAGALAVYKFAREAFTAAARVSEMNVAMDAIGKSTGVGSTAIHEAAKAIKNKGIEMAAAQKIAVTYAQNNLDLARAADVARVAQDLAVISQRNSTDTAELLTRAIQTGNSMLLKSAGISRMAGEAYDAYAKKLGKSSTALTAVERQTAMVNMIMEEGQKVAGVYEASMTEAGKVLRSFPRLMNDIQVSFGSALVKGFGPTIKAVYDLTNTFDKAVSEGGKFWPVIEALQMAMKRLLDPFTQGIRHITNWIHGLEVGKDKVKGISDAIVRFLPIIAALGTYLSTLAGNKLLLALGGQIPIFKNLAAVMNPVTSGLAVLVMLSPRLRDEFLKLGQAFMPLVDAMKNILPIIMGVAEGFVSMVTDVVAVVAGPLAAIIGGISSGIDALSKHFGALKPVLQLVATAIGINFVKSTVVGAEAMKKMTDAAKTMVAPLMRMWSNFSFGYQTLSKTMSSAAAAQKAFAGMMVATFKAVGLAAKEMALSMIEVLAPLVAIYAVIKIIQLMGGAAKQTKERTNELNDALKEQIDVLRVSKDQAGLYLASLDNLSKLLFETGENGQKLTAAFNVLGLTQKDYLANLALLKGVEDTYGHARVAYYESILKAQGVEERWIHTIAQQVHENESLSDVLSGIPAQYQAYAKALEEVDDQAEKTSIKDLVKQRLDQISVLGKEQAAWAVATEAKTKAAMAQKGVTNDTIVYTEVMKALTEQYPVFLAQQRAKAAADLAASQTTKSTAKSVQTLVESLNALALAEGEAKFRGEDLAKTLFGIGQVEFNKATQSMLDMRREMTSVFDEVKKSGGSMDNLTSSALKLATNIANNAATMKDLGKSGEEISAMQSIMVKGFIDAAKAANFNDAQIKQLLSSLGLLQNYRTVAKVDLDISEAMAKLDALNINMTILSNPHYSATQAKEAVTKKTRELIESLKKERKALLDGANAWRAYDNGASNASKSTATTTDRLKALTDNVRGSISGIFSLTNAYNKMKGSQDEAKAGQDALAESGKRLNEARMSGNWEEYQQALTAYADASKKAGEADKKRVTFMQALEEQSKQAIKFAGQIRRLRNAGLSEAGIQQILAAGAESGGKIADELLAGSAAEIQAKVGRTNSLYKSITDLADSTAKSTAKYYKNAGIELGKALTDGIASVVGKFGVTIYKGAVTKSTPVPHMATGGIVKATRGGTLALLGEGGRDEMVVPLPKNGAFPVGIQSMRPSVNATNHYHINVETGVGDPVAIGREVLKTLQAVQARNGALPLSVKGTR